MEGVCAETRLKRMGVIIAASVYVLPLFWPSPFPPHHSPSPPRFLDLQVLWTLEVGGRKGAFSLGYYGACVFAINRGPRHALNNYHNTRGGLSLS